jgi:hypothetical protein
MRIEVDFEGGKNAAGIYVHKKLPEAMGNSVAAFAHAVLSGHTQPGVWYPEEKEALAVSLYCCQCRNHSCYVFATVAAAMRLGPTTSRLRRGTMMEVQYTLAALSLCTAGSVSLLRRPPCAKVAKRLHVGGRQCW